jgi:hypothetical protein
MNKHKWICLASTMIAILLGGCAGNISGDTSHAAAADLTSAGCPARLEVQVDAPRILTDGEVLQSPPGQPPDEAAATLNQLAAHLTLARGGKPVTLSGTLIDADACAYETTRAPTGDSAYRIELPKTPKGLSLRIAELVNGKDQLFIEVPTTNVSPTEIVIDPSATASISAVDEEESIGFSVPIGTVKVTAKIVH